MSITHAQYVFVALGAKNAVRCAILSHLWPSPLYNNFPHFLINGTIFGRSSYSTQNTCVDFLYSFCL